WGGVPTRYAQVIPSAVHRGRRPGGRVPPAEGRDSGGGRLTMRCPYCRHPDSRVVDSREVDDGQVIRRRRACQDCGRRFTTVEEPTLAVIKRSGVTEP